MDISDLKTTSDELEAGEWVGDLPNLGDVDLLIRPVQSYTVKRALGRAMRAVGPEGRAKDGSILPEVQDEIDYEVARDFVLLGWRNLTREGEELPYDKGLAGEYLRLPVFAEAVQTASIRAAQRGAERLEKLKGNSPAPSK